MATNPAPASQLRMFTALVAETLREAFTRRLVWAVYGSSLFILAFLLFVLEIDIVTGAKSTISLFGQEAMSTESSYELFKFIKLVQGSIGAFLYGVSTFVGVFVGAGLTPALFEPGRLEVLLSRPVSRTTILLGRYTGNLLLVGINILLLIGGSFLILGWKSTIWNPGYLWAIPITFFIYAVLMSIVLLISVWTESVAVAMIVTFLAIVFSPILAQEDLAIRLLSSEFSRYLWRGAYLLVPKVFDLGNYILMFVRGFHPDTLFPLISSGAVGLACLAGSIVVFSRKDF